MKFQYFVDIVQAVSKASKCSRLQVGSIIVEPNGKIVSTGFNGSPMYVDDDVFPPEINGQTADYVIHSELNSILFAKGNTEGNIMICTHSPCLKCAATIKQVGITHVLYLQKYRNDDGEKFLNENGIKCWYITEGYYHRTLNYLIT